jgi:hypothetical protein
VLVGLVGCRLVVAVSASRTNGACCFANLSPLRAGLFFSLYVGVGVFNFPHVWLREKLCFAFATFFCARFGVG